MSADESGEAASDVLEEFLAGEMVRGIGRRMLIDRGLLAVADERGQQKQQ
jgi:hypothetical protein